MTDAISAAALLERIEEVAESVAFQAGVGGIETAGAIVSFLAAHPDWIGAFMARGWLGLPTEIHLKGNLTWQGSDGKIYGPQDVRISQIVKSMRPAS
jgi:hypothetical protein